MTSPFFSIIIPTYNRSVLIKEAINSVINQSFKDFELIIVDDGSTDNTKEVITSYDDKRIIYIYQNNAERSVARNNGIKNSSGKFICFLDSDDDFKTNHLQLFYNEIIANNSPICMFFSKILSPEQLDKSYNKYEQVLKYMIHVQETCIHKDIFDEELFDPKLHIGEDFDLWIRIVDKFPIYHINEQTVIIKVHEERTVNLLKDNVFAYSLKVFKKIYSSSNYKGKISERVINETISDCYFGIAKHYLYNGKNFLGSYNMFKSIFININSSYKYKINLILNGLINKKKLKLILESEIK